MIRLRLRPTHSSLTGTVWRWARAHRRESGPRAALPENGARRDSASSATAAASVPDNVGHPVDYRVALVDARLAKERRVVERREDEELSARLLPEDLKEQLKRRGLEGRVHVLVELVERAHRRRRELPHGEDERQGREGLLATRQRAERRRRAGRRVARPRRHLRLEHVLLVVEPERPAHRAAAQVHLEVGDGLHALRLEEAAVELVPLLH
mmetsp:Transcript_20043/g.57458  ORF Transcript_20043/g.57458 Transcript_20043/m.57458 type:complete len:211 (-) Transcript_20043:117-749(-)